MISREELERKLESFRSGEVSVPLRAALAGRIRETLTLRGRSGESDVRTGGSRAGGNPDLPPDMAWPVLRNGTPMTFIAQIDLAEAAAADKTGLLPAAGMLYFFLGDTEPSTRMEHLVVFREDAGELRRTAPERTPHYLAERVPGGVNAFAACGLEPGGGLNLPTRYYAADVLKGFEDRLDNEDRVEEFYEDYDALVREADGEWIAKMFGYGRDRHGDLEYEAALRLQADLEYTCYPEEALESLTAHFNGDAAQARAAVENTLMLLEVRSGPETGFMWGESGVLHYFIHRDDLLHRRFDRTYASVFSD